MESEELPSSSKENMQTRKDSSTTNIDEEQNMQTKRKRYLPNYPVSCDYSDLKKWPIFGYLHKEFASQIHMIMVFKDDSAIIMSKDRMVYGLGNNDNGQLGINENSCIQPAKVKTLCGKNIKTFYCDDEEESIFALTEEGEVYCWGNNENHKLGRNIDSQTNKKIYMPGKIDSLSEKCIIDIATNCFNTLALTDSGKIYIWGDVEFSNNLFNINPSQVKFDSKEEKFINIASGETFLMALSKDGKLYSWGLNDSGQLGLNLATSEKRMIPCLIASLIDITIIKVVCGNEHALALTSKGKIYSWGSNSDGQLGLGKETKLRLEPVMLNVAIMGNVSDIAAQNDKSVAVNKLGYVYVWGQHVCWQVTWEPVRSAYSNIYDMFKYNISYIVHDSTEEKSNMLQYLEAFNDQLTSDLTIKIEGKLIYVHKVILKIRCQYFRNIFQKWAESDPNVIEYNDFSYNVYETFLKYLYTDVVDHLSVEDTFEFLKLCHKYNDTDLERKCIKIIRQNITVSNVILYYAKAIKYNVKDLEEFCFEYAFCHMTDVIESNAFDNLKETEILFDFIIKISKAGIFKT